MFSVFYKAQINGQLNQLHFVYVSTDTQKSTKTENYRQLKEPSLHAFEAADVKICFPRTMKWKLNIIRTIYFKSIQIKYDLLSVHDFM